MKKPVIAIPSFPGSNGEVDNVKTLKRCGFDAFVFRWNDSTKKLANVDGYFFGAGFSYEDRGRSGMVAARDPLFDFIRAEAAKGKVVIGNCNGAQVLIESGLIPLGDSLRMCLAHNAYKENEQWVSPGFINEWVWITRSCSKGRCATSYWDDVMHIPIAHGEGRFITTDPACIAELEKNDQIAFQYCTKQGVVDENPPITPNGSMRAIAGICNKEGNVVALMPHPERTPLGDNYLLSIHTWLKEKKNTTSKYLRTLGHSVTLPVRAHRPCELFIGSLITNNEERTVEQAARRLTPSLRLKQWKYISVPNVAVAETQLCSLSSFNPNKEVAFARIQSDMYQWNSATKILEKTTKVVLRGISLLRRNCPDTGLAQLGNDAETGICYDCREVEEEDILRSDLLEIFYNPHASTLERLPTLPAIS